MKPILFVMLLTLRSTGSFAQQNDTTDARIRIAVVPFMNNTGDSSFDKTATGVGESISTALAASGQFEVVERIQVAKALTEQNFQMSDHVDARSVQAVGEILGVKYLIVGDLQRNKSRLRINARRMRVSDGSLMEAASADGDDDDLFELQDEVAEELLKKMTGDHGSE